LSEESILSRRLRRALRASVYAETSLIRFICPKNDRAGRYVILAGDFRWINQRETLTSTIITPLTSNSVID